MTPVPTPTAGFAGTDRRVVFEIERDGHALRVVEYAFGATRELYVEAAEDPAHSSAPPVLVHLSAAVHLLQNVTEAELWSIGNREGG